MTLHVLCVAYHRPIELGILIGCPHQRLSGHMKDELRFVFGKYTLQVLQIAYVALDMSYFIFQLTGGKVVGLAGWCQRISGYFRSQLSQPDGQP